MLKKWLSRVKDTGGRTKSAFLLAFASLGLISLVAVPISTTHAQAPSDLSSGYSSGVSTCAIETVGWVICPVMRSIAKLADYGFAFINQNFLRIDYDVAANDSGIYVAWEVMRNIANVIFVLVFIVIIYSQITGRNAGGYTIKRLLPRLIIGAILVNISYHVCVVFIDLSNITGDAIINVMKGIAERIGTPTMSLDSAANGFEDGILIDITSAILTKTGTVWILLAPVAAVTVSIAAICAAGLVLLIMRKVIVAMLVLASPLLFIAYLLPNLERYFQQWTRLSIQLLLIYPIIAFLLGAGQIVSATIVNVGSGGNTNYRVQDDNYQTKSGGSGSATTDLAASGAAVLPLLGVWFALKGVMAVAGSARSKVTASAGRRNKDDGTDKLKAKVTGKANSQPPAARSGLMGSNFGGRRPAFTRRRRNASLGSSAKPLEGGDPAKRSTPGAALSNMFNKNKPGDQQNQDVTDALDAAKKLEELNSAKANLNAGDGDLQLAAAQATLDGGANDGKPDDKSKQKNDKKSLSKDQQRSFGTAGGKEQTGGANSQSAPAGGMTNDFKAPSVTQAANTIVNTGGGGGVAPKIIAVPVPVRMEGGSPIDSQLPQETARPLPAPTRPPTSGIQEKAKARAQKYIFDAASALEQAEQKLDSYSTDQTADDIAGDLKQDKDQ